VLDIPILALAAVIVFGAYVVRGMTGFASALVAVPLLTLIFGDIRPALVTMSLFQLAFAFAMLPCLHRYVDWRCFWYLVPCTFLGSAVGVQILKSLATGTMKKALGVIIILFALNMLLRGGYPNWRARKPWGLVFGALGGMIGGMFGTAGPVYVVYMAGQTKEKSVFRATLGWVFATSGIWRLILYAHAGFVTPERAANAGMLLPACLLGLFIGHHIHLRASEGTFRRIVAVILLISGLLCLLRPIQKPESVHDVRAAASNSLNMAGIVCEYVGRPPARPSSKGLFGHVD
jgi:uncharacterized membrane protein YfcA